VPVEIGLDDGEYAEVQRGGLALADEVIIMDRVPEPASTARPISPAARIPRL
jgi:hypothetical protein